MRLFSRKPDAADAAVRFVILKHEVVHVLTSPPKEVMEQLGPEERRAAMAEFQQLAEQLERSLRALGLWGRLNRDEQTFLRTPSVELDEEFKADVNWWIEAESTLLWALHQRDALGPYDEPADAEILNSIATDSLPAWIKSATLRTEAELESATHAAELWHWRSRTHALAQSESAPPLPPGVENLVQVAKMAAAAAVESKRLDGLIGGDFPAIGKAYHEVSDAEAASLDAIAMGRHHALNWLRGKAPRNDWWQTPTDT